MKLFFFDNISYFILLILLIACTLTLGVGLGRDSLRREAILAGHAQWVPSKDGYPTFEWNKACDKSHRP